MEELRVFCVRMLGDTDAAGEAERAARGAGHGDRVQGLRAAVAACRAHVSDGTPAHPADPVDAPDLAAAVAGELSAATAQLPERQREALALRELLGLSHDELGAVVGLDPVAVGPLLARARLRLRTALRGEGPPLPPCDERERALRTISLRQDGEEVPAPDEDWLLEHLGHCVGCARSHSAMLEAAVCYRAWRSEETVPGP
jgi:hypothetical protein